MPLYFLWAPVHAEFFNHFKANNLIVGAFQEWDNTNVLLFIEVIENVGLNDMGDIVVLLLLPHLFLSVNDIADLFVIP